MNVLDLFSGIGGFSLGLERAGMTTVAFCEIEPFPRKVLAKHWPDVPIYEDVRELTYDRLKSDGIPRIDVICGGFPCQDISTAGKQAGIGEGTRSGLWSEIARLISEIQPRYAVMENVTALISGDRGGWFGRILGDLAEIGYDAEWHCIPASELGAHHHRDRVWIIAYPNSEKPGRLPIGASKENPCSCGSCEILADSRRCGLQGQRQLISSVHPAKEKDGETVKSINGCIGSVWEIEPRVGRVADGISNATHRLKALGNAVVPQIPELIGRAIMNNELTEEKQ